MFEGGLTQGAGVSSRIWIEQQWEKARIQIKKGQRKEVVLIIDEVQKIPDWSSTVKRFWGEDTIDNINIKVILPGSSQLLLQRGLQKFSKKEVSGRSSSPKFQALNNALVSAGNALSFHEERSDRGYWGRLVESAVGAHLLNSVSGTDIEVFYRRDRNFEVDFVLSSGKKITAIEVKSGIMKKNLSGMERFKTIFPEARVLLEGGGGIPIDEFLRMDAGDML